jgi:hypothetical protein
MNELDIQSSLASLRQQSRTSLVLVSLGAAFLAFSLYYSASRLTPLEAEITAKRQQIARLAEEEAEQRKRLVEAQAAFEKLRASTESLYSVRVTPANQVYELKAAAIATGRQLSGGRPEYRFTLFINSPKETLSTIQRVTYRMKHETFKQQDYVSDDPDTQFSTSYVGWGCLTKVTVTVELKGGASQDFEFNMCRSLGPQWQ